MAARQRPQLGAAAHEAGAAATRQLQDTILRRAGGATRYVFSAPQADTPDEEYVADWTAMIAGRIEAVR